MKGVWEFGWLTFYSFDELHCLRNWTEEDRPLTRWDYWRSLACILIRNVADGVAVAT